MDKLQEENRLRSLMVGQISHDLRTPLNTIIVLLELVQDLTYISQSFKDEYIDPALTNCNLLMSLINDILDFTRADFNSDQEIQMNYEAVNLRKIIKKISLGFIKRTKLRGIDFKYEIDENIPVKFNTDP